MKMMFLSYKESADDEVMDILKELDIQAYTRWPEVHAKTRTGRPQMGTHIWPGYNSALMFSVEDEVAEALMGRIRAFNEATKYEGITAACWTVDDFCWK